MRRSALCAMVRACLLCAALAHAAERRPRDQGFLNRLRRDDRDGDGKVTRAEFTGPARLYRRLDRNGDGSIDATEAQAFLKQGGSQRRPGVNRPAPEGVEVTRDIVYGKGGDVDLKLDLYLPKGERAEPLPVVVWIHGGAWRAGSRAANRAAGLVPKGFASVSISYRLTHQAIFPAQIHDCKCAIRWVRAHAGEYGFHPKRIGVWGSSAGGHLVAMLGTSAGVKALEGTGGWAGQDSAVQAVVDYFGPSDLVAMVAAKSHMDHNGPNSPEGKLVGGTVLDNQHAARKASPVTYVSGDEPPFLIAHGEQDLTVPFSQSVILHDALKKAGVDVTFLPVKRGGHGFRGNTDPTPRTIQQTVFAFLEKHLKKPAQPAAETRP